MRQKRQGHVEWPQEGPKEELPMKTLWPNAAGKSDSGGFHPSGQARGKDGGSKADARESPHFDGFPVFWSWK